jgi:hypothetical protein
MLPGTYNIMERCYGVKLGCPERSTDNPLAMRVHNKNHFGTAVKYISAERIRGERC